MCIMFRLVVLIMTFVTVQAVNAADGSGIEENQGLSNAGSPPAYPTWPGAQVHKNDVPPPPPGPYMSTALAYAGHGFSCCPGSEVDADGNKQKPVNSPFLKNMQWPEEGRRPPQQWLPPTGGEYIFAPDDNKFAPEPIQPERYGFQGRPPWQPMYPPPPREYR